MVVVPDACFEYEHNIAGRLMLSRSSKRIPTAPKDTPAPFPAQVSDHSVEASSSRVASSESPSQVTTRALRALAMAGAGSLLLVGVFVWAFWYTFVDLWHVWQNNPDYGAGPLVPLAAACMIAARRNALAQMAPRYSLAGFCVFGVGLALNVLGNKYLYASLENVGMVVCVNGLAMGLLGWHRYKRVWFPFLFLLLMIPLPGRLHDAVLLPLQGFSAHLAAVVMEVIGIPAERFGHVLEVGGHQVAVAEACSGLRMVLAFLLVTGVVVYFSRGPRWQKVAVLVSSVPIALVCNVLRIVIMASLCAAGYEGLAEGAFHEIVGLLMMPVALCLILLEQRVLTRAQAASYRLGVFKPTVPKPDNNRPRTPDSNMSWTSAKIITATVALLLGAGTLHRSVYFSRSRATSTFRSLPASLSELPQQLGVYEFRQELSLTPDVLKVAGVDSFVYREYIDPASNRPVLVYVGYWGYENTGLGHGPDVCFPAVGWRTEGKPVQRMMRFPTQDRGMTKAAAALHHFSRNRPEGLERVAVAFVAVVDGQFQASSLESYRHRPPSSPNEGFLAHIQVSTAATNSRWDAADRRVGDFMQLLLPHVSRCLLEGTSVETEDPPSLQTMGNE